MVVVRCLERSVIQNIVKWIHFSQLELNLCLTHFCRAWFIHRTSSIVLLLVRIVSKILNRHTDVLDVTELPSESVYFLRRLGRSLLLTGHNIRSDTVVTFVRPRD